MAPRHRTTHRVLQIFALTGWVVAALGFTGLPSLLWAPLDAWATTAARGLWWVLVIIHPIEMLVFAPTLRRRGRLDASNLLGIFVFGGIHLLGIRWTDAAANAEDS